jgi:3'-phosphoadenosine 5'-phosphosulfate sulfotransferase (PAPS reductase)/FAD synthetase
MGSNLSYFVSVSGGLDSTALAIILSKKIPQAKYIFADTGDEFPQVYEHLSAMENILNIKIIRIRNKQYTLGEYEIERKYFPSPGARFCTRKFKIEPIERYLKNYRPFKLAIGIRADENRKGNIADYAIYPLIEYNIKKCDVVTICQEKNLIPKYPWYMSRGGCYSCFYKSKNELLGLAKYEPALFDELIEREETVQDKRKKHFTMFEHLNYRPLREVKRIAETQEQVEMFDNGPLKFQDCGVFCRK